MAYKYVCKATGLACDTEYEDDSEEKVRRQAEEHIRAHHPDQAVDGEKANAMLVGGIKPA